MSHFKVEAKGMGTVKGPHGPDTRFAPGPGNKAVQGSPRLKDDRTYALAAEHGGSFAPDSGKQAVAWMW